MESVIITVRLISSSIEYDIEVSPNLPLGELAGQIVDAVKSKDFETVRTMGPYVYLSTPDGRRLPNDATLGGIGLWDGSILILGSEPE